MAANQSETLWLGIGLFCSTENKDALGDLFGAKPLQSALDLHIERSIELRDASEP